MIVTKESLFFFLKDTRGKGCLPKTTHVNIIILYYSRDEVKAWLKTINCLWLCLPSYRKYILLTDHIS